jgi:anti-sigma regulatory factor (Ser/Thr protein kinase)
MWREPIITGRIGKLKLGERREKPCLFKIETSSPRNHLHTFELCETAQLRGDLAKCIGEAYFEEQQLTRVGVALEEALSNAMIHGNLEISSDLRTRDDGAYEEAIRTRQTAPEYRDRRIHVRCRFTPAVARFEIADQGPGFDVSRVPDPNDPANFLKPSGRGLLLIRSFMDEVFHNPTGNHITLIKRGGPGATAGRAVESNSD